MSHSFPPPSIQSFERLRATDGLLINAERWRKSHEYHRKRQNLHYQALHQPGIVCGLGVRVIPAPQQYEAQYRDYRWIQIQPGIAIDLEGNVIVVSEPQNYRLTAKPANSETITVHVVISYRDPDDLQQKGTSEMVKEWFRLDEKITPSSNEIILCRVLLQGDNPKLAQPKDVFFPSYNQIDLRPRISAQSRPQALVRLAQLTHADPQHARSLRNLPPLLNAVEALYPALRGADELAYVSLEESLQAYDLLYLTGQQGLSFNVREIEALKTYLEQGGVLLVDAPAEATELINTTQGLAQQLGLSLAPLQRNHPLRNRPFLFAAWPMVNQQPLRITTDGGIILVVGDLASSWGIDEEMSLPRIALRTAHELGINILSYAWKRRQMMGLQQEDFSGYW